MHSSRMRTGRSLTVCCSLLLPGPGGGCLLGPRGWWSAWSGGVVCLVPGGCLLGPGGGWSARSRGVSARSGGVSAWSRGIYLPPPPVNRITHTCKNITLATTSLWPVTSLIQVLKLAVADPGFS